MAGVLTLAFLSPLHFAGQVALCCFSGAIPLLAVYRLSAIPHVNKRVRPNAVWVYRLTHFSSLLAVVVGFGFLLYDLFSIAAWIYIAFALIGGAISFATIEKEPQ